MDADDVRGGKAGDLDVLRRGGAERHLRAAAAGEKLQIDPVVHGGADLSGVDDLLTQQEKRPSVAADKVKVAVLQIVGFIGQQLKRAGRGGQGVLGRQRDGGGLLYGVAQRVAAVAHIELVVGAGLAAKQGQGLGAAVQQNRVAELLVRGKALHQLPLGGEGLAAVEPQAMVAAGLGDHPDLTVPVKDHRERQVEIFFQRDAPVVGGAVVVQLADLKTALAGGEVHRLGEQPALAAPVVEQRVGKPPALPPGQQGVGAAFQSGQRLGALGSGAGAHGDGVDFFFAHDFAQQPLGRHVQGAVKLVHDTSSAARRPYSFSRVL